MKHVYNNAGQTWKGTHLVDANVSPWGNSMALFCRKSASKIASECATHNDRKAKSIDSDTRSIVLEGVSMNDKREK